MWPRSKEGSFAEGSRDPEGAFSTPCSLVPVLALAEMELIICLIAAPMVLRAVTKTTLKAQQRFT